MRKITCWCAFLCLITLGMNAQSDNNSDDRRELQKAAAMDGYMPPIDFNDLLRRYEALDQRNDLAYDCLLYTSPSPRDRTRSRMPSSA